MTEDDYLYPRTISVCPCGTWQVDYTLGGRDYLGVVYAVEAAIHEHIAVDHGAADPVAWIQAQAHPTWLVPQHDPTWQRIVRHIDSVVADLNDRAHADGTLPSHIRLVYEYDDDPRPATRAANNPTN